MLSYIYVMLGGALGSGARFWASGIVARRVGEFSPFGTWTVNVTGSFISVFFGTLTEPEGTLRLHDFSSFSLQTLDLAQGGDWLKAESNAVISLVFCLVAGWLGRVCSLTFRST